MEVLSKGVHRAMVPVDSYMENVGAVGVELVESAPSYRMLTQMDVLRFLKEHAGGDYELQSMLGRSVRELGAINQNVYAITDRTRLIDAIKCLKTAMLNAVPIVRASDLGGDDEDHKHLVHVSLSIHIYIPYLVIIFSNKCEGPGPNNDKMWSPISINLLGLGLARMSIDKM